MKLHLGRPAMRDLCPAAIIGLGLVVAACGGSSEENGTAGVGDQAPAASAASPSDQPAFLREFLSKFPAELTDVDALADSLETPAEAFAFVRDRIAFEPYRGIMKGARGTLLTRGGNSVDRALLLSALLERQGHSASIVGGDLPDMQAAAIVAETSRRPGAVDQLAAALPSTLTGLRSESGERQALFTSSEARGATFRTEAEATRTALIGALQRGGHQPVLAGAGDPIGSLGAHYWVRASLPGGVVDLDPTLESGAEGARFAEVKQTFDPANPPAELAQRLVVRVVAEYVDAGALEENDLVRAETNVADVAGQAIRLVIGPKALARAQNDFVVQVTIGDAPPVGAEFQITSTTGASTTGPKNAVADLLAGEDSPETGPTLGRLALEVVSHVPGVPDIAYRRVIFDRLEAADAAIRPDMRDDESVRSLLLQAWDGVIDVGAMHPARLVDIRLQAAIAQQPMLQLAYDASKPFTLDALAPPTLSPLVAGFLYFSGLTHAQTQAEHAAESRVYHLRPRVAFLRNGIAIDDWTQTGTSRRFQRSIDLLNAPFGIVGPSAQASNLALRLGMADAMLERSFAKPGEDFTTTALMLAAAAQRVPVIVVPAGQESAVAGLDVPPEMIAVLRGELRQGRTLVLPTNLVGLNDIRTLGWWSFDAESGVPLGQMELGAGQAGVEIAPLTRKVMEMTQLIITFYGNILGCFYMEAAGQLGDTTGSTSPYANIRLAPKPQGGRSLAQCIMTNACEAIVGYTMMISTSYKPEFAKEAIRELTEMVVQMLIAEKATIMACESL